LTDRTRLLVAVCLLEMSSGLPYGIVNELTPTWLAVRHVDLAALGALNLVGLPWTLRAFWAPAVDRYATFRHWMMGALLVCMGATGLLALRAAAAPEVGPAVEVATVGVAPSFADTVARLTADPFLGPVAGLLLLLAIASATQDVAIDGYIAARVPPAEAGRVNGLRISSYRVAMALAGGLAGWVGATWSWPLAFALLLVPAAVFLVAQARVAPAPRPPHVPTADWWRGLAAWFAAFDARPSMAATRPA
jgi:PAT family beta-lactamase induction signal transducer AmpG